MDAVSAVHHEFAGGADIVAGSAEVFCDFGGRAVLDFNGPDFRAGQIDDEIDLRTRRRAAGTWNPIWGTSRSR